MTEEQKTKITQLHDQGMGYKSIAKVMGMQSGTVAGYFRRVRIREQTKHCRNCGRKLQLIPGHRKKEFCSEKCRYLWRIDHVDERNLKAFHHKKCEYCGKDFTVYSDTTKRFCCRDCYLKAIRGIKHEE